MTGRQGDRKSQFFCHLVTLSPCHLVIFLLAVPLVPAAVALTAGIVADRWFSIPLAYSLLLGSSGLLAWLIVFSTSPKPRESLLYLTLAGVALWRCLSPRLAARLSSR